MQQYIYIAIAIPYALGYGNYKGDGIAGLITLAADGGRLDRSIIFMIEGILAIFLVLIGIFLMYICFRMPIQLKKIQLKEQDLEAGLKLNKLYLKMDPIFSFITSSYNYYIYSMYSSCYYNSFIIHRNGTRYPS